MLEEDRGGGIFYVRKQYHKKDRVKTVSKFESPSHVPMFDLVHKNLRVSFEYSLKGYCEFWEGALNVY